MKLWNNDIEIQFFKEALKNFASPEQLFYKLQSGYFAYIPTGVGAEGKTLQSRNALIGRFTEKWCKNLFYQIARRYNLYAVNSVVCEEIGLIRSSNADLAFCTTEEIQQKPENIKIIFEIKMSITSNYQYKHPDNVTFVGDYKQHIGVPSFTRSDSMLKAIGKAINIRVSGINSAKIPIVILGNTPMSDNYLKKVDFLKTSGVIQGFWSLNPTPTTSAFTTVSPKLGFQTITSTDTLYTLCQDLLLNDLNFFSSMISKTKLGEIIRLANEETADEAKAEKFLNLIRS